MTTINLYKEKADYFEDMSCLLIKMSLCCAIAFNDPEVMDTIHPYRFSLDKDKKILEKALKKCTKEVKDFLSAKRENLFEFFNIYSDNLWDMKIAERDNLTNLANLNIAFSQICRMLSKGYEINKDEYKFWHIEKAIIEQSNKIMGYWTAKLGDYRHVIEGAITRKRISSRKVNELLKVCKEYEIYCAKDFNKNKRIRQKFMTDAKDRLNVFSERRVLDYLKMIEPHKEILTKSREKEKIAR
jgi:hypothetical protein